MTASLTTSLFLKPSNPEQIVRDPETRRALAVDGSAVAASAYWRRRLKDGDVQHAKRPALPRK